MTERSGQLAELILEIEVEMRRLGLWEDKPPPDQALRSQQPFAIDTLAFTQWLQWIFLARISRLLQQGGRLPERCEMSPAAEEAFKFLDEETDRLLALLERADRLISQGGSMPHLH